jgi:hypothetical protein
MRGYSNLVVVLVLMVWLTAIAGIVYLVDGRIQPWGLK